MAESIAQLDAPARRAARRLVTAKTLSQLGDLLANPKTVLTWLMSSVGAPAGLIGMLVPIRESGSMLPQLWLTGVVARFERRKWACVLGGVGQALACLGIAAMALATSGRVAGVSILIALGLFAGLRALSSIAGKDVLGRTIPRGARGRVGGLGTSLSGALGGVGALAALVWLRSEVEASLYAAIVGLGALGFVGSALAYASVDEPRPREADASQTPDARSKSATPREASDPPPWRDATLRRFVVVRGLLLGSALGGPILVLFGHEGSDRLSSLAAFVVAGSTASAASGWLWGRLADRSGRLAMAWGGAVAATVGAAAVVVRHLTVPTAVPAEAWAAMYFVFAVGYAGVRVGRKTYVVDIAEGDRRTAYVAASNTAIAIALLAYGAVGAVVQAFSTSAALGLFVGSTALGAWGARRWLHREPTPEAEAAAS